VGDPPPGSAAQRAQVELGLFSAVLPAYISIAAILDTETHHWLLVGLLPLAVWAYRIPRLGLHAVKGDPKKYWWKGVLLVLAGVAAGVVIGLVISSYIIGKAPPPKVSIATPASSLDCRTQGPQCQFRVTGRLSRAAAGLEIFVLVSPVDPPGHGWYVQLQPAGIGGNGDWAQSPSYLGAPGYPVSNGDTLEVEAVLVSSSATYNGTALSSLANPIPDPEQITGIVTESKIVFLTVRK